MSTGAPVEMYWDPELLALRPTNINWARRAAKQFAAGEVYHVVDQEPRSSASHNHYFAAITEAWRNLPEAWAERFPTADHLRKYALIRTGWHNSNSMPVGSHAAALKLASFIKPMDEFAVVDVPQDGTVVTVYTAKSQDRRMGKDDFEKSKEDVLAFVADMIGVKLADLRKARSA